jgi:phosphoribosylformylglycinamidine synthase
MDWVWEQYDSQVMGNTIHGLQKDPAIVRIPNSNKGVAITTMSDAHMCNHNPKQGVASIIENCYNKLKAVGAEPLGITNCLNFGNPENENVMYEFAKTVMVMAETCKKLEFPVVSGNVSFYNETSGKGIMPTPVIGGVGLML